MLIKLLTIEFTVCVGQDGKLPIPPAYIFMIDVSYQSVKSGLVSLLCGRIRSVLADLPRYLLLQLLFLYFTVSNRSLQVTEYMTYAISCLLKGN